MKLVYRCTLLLAVLFVFAAAPVPAQQAEQPAITATPAKAKKPAVTGKININTATAEQLAMLPGISMKKALGLIDYRTKNGKFKNIDDLRNIPKIKQKRINKVQDYLIFDGETTLKAIE